MDSSLENSILGLGETVSKKIDYNIQLTEAGTGKRPTLGKTSQDGNSI